MPIRNGLTALLLSASLLVGSIVSAQITVVPAGINPGDPYRLVYVTVGTTLANSSDISTYNTFVSNDAAGNPLLVSTGATWSVIGSTQAVAAHDNTGTNPASGAGVPIYDLQGNKIADNNFDLWDGTLDTGISYSRDGAFYTQAVWTGTEIDGTPLVSGTFGSLALGAGPVGNKGFANFSTGIWVNFNTDFANTESLPLYAISSVIPEPSYTLLAIAVAGFVVIRRRRSRK